MYMCSSFKEAQNSVPLNCRTEKDRGVRLNHRTAGINNTSTIVLIIIIFAGILAGMWPCGIITFIRELFIAESKSQVYGHIHQFLQNNSETASHLRKLLN